MERTRGVVVVAPADSSLGVAMLAALQAHGWQASGSLDVPIRYAAGPATLLILEDDSGVPRLGVPLHGLAGVVVAVGSVRSLPLLISLTRQGARVVNQATPFAPLLGLVEQALRQPAPVDRAQTARQVAALGRRAAEQAALARLTEAEAEALDGLVAGLSAVQIAQRTHRSLHTVRSHIKAVLAKLEVRSQVAAVAVAHRSRPMSGLDDARRYITIFSDEL